MIDELTIVPHSNPNNRYYHQPVVVGFAEYGGLSDSSHSTYNGATQVEAQSPRDFRNPQQWETPNMTRASDFHAQNGCLPALNCPPPCHLNFQVKGSAVTTQAHLTRQKPDHIHTSQSEMLSVSLVPLEASSLCPSSNRCFQPLQMSWIVLK